MVVTREVSEDCRQVTGPSSCKKCERGRQLVQPNVPKRQIRAVFDEDTLTVYQAYSPSIAKPAVAAQRFVTPFSRDRMTWVKPSLLWIMYRSRWATKPGQERVLAVKVTRVGFEEALADACLSHFDPEVYTSREAWQQRKAVTSVRVQWDPERDAGLRALPWRSLQVGIGGSAVAAYVDRWVVAIEDITERVGRLRALPAPGSIELPAERLYPLPPGIAATIGASPGG